MQQVTIIGAGMPALRPLCVWRNEAIASHFERDRFVGGKFRATDGGPATAKK